MNIIDCTIKMKDETRKHFELLAEAATDKELKQLFSLLAKGEEEYVEKLVTFRDSVKKGSLSLDSIEERVCVFSPNIDVQNLGKALRNDPDAYGHVVREEEEAIGFFDQLAEQTRDMQMKAVCNALAAREREHLAMVENIYSFVEDPRTYLEWGEFSNLKSL